jgi:hypothetical protein
MKRPSSAAGLALAALAVLGLVGPVAAGEQVPFRGRLAGVESSQLISVSPPILEVMDEVTGTATQLGKFTLASHGLVNLATMSGTGSYYFIAANGDTLSANFSGQASPTPTPGVFSIVETATITGGIGRFAGATGGFTVERLVDEGTGATSGSFNGTIKVSAQKRRD